MQDSARMAGTTTSALIWFGAAGGNHHWLEAIACQHLAPQRTPHTRKTRVRSMHLTGESAASDVQTGHHDERQVGQSEEQHRREDALARVLHMFPSSSALMRNSTEVTPPNVHSSAKRVSRSFSNVWSDQSPTTFPDWIVGLWSHDLHMPRSNLFRSAIQ